MRRNIKKPRSPLAIIKQSFLILEVKAKAGDVEAQYQLGEMYFNGFILRPNRGQACKWLQLAIKNGYPKAQAMLDKVNKKKNSSRVVLSEAEKDKEAETAPLFVNLSH